MIDVDFKSFVLGRSVGTVLVSGEPSEKKYGKTLDFVPTGVTFSPPNFGTTKTKKNDVYFAFQAILSILFLFMKKSHFLGEKGWDWEPHPPFIVTKSQQNHHVVLVLKSWDWVRRKKQGCNTLIRL